MDIFEYTMYDFQDKRMYISFLGVDPCARTDLNCATNQQCISRANCAATGTCDYIPTDATYVCKDNKFVTNSVHVSLKMIFHK